MFPNPPTKWDFPSCDSSSVRISWPQANKLLHKYLLLISIDNILCRQMSSRVFRGTSRLNWVACHAHRWNTNEMLTINCHPVFSQVIWQVSTIVFFIANLRTMASSVNRKANMVLTASERTESCSHACVMSPVVLRTLICRLLFMIYEILAELSFF